MNIIARIALTQHLSFLMANVMLHAHIAYCTLTQSILTHFLNHLTSLKMSFYSNLGHQLQSDFQMMNVYDTV